MPEKSSAALGHWREYFRSADAEIFDVIEQAIMVAASDCPKEFRVRRDGIAALLFSCNAVTRCSRCDSAELAAMQPEGRGDDDLGFKSEFGDGVAIKESKSNRCRYDRAELNGDQQVSNYSYGEAEALTDKIDEENEVIAEVLSIKEVLQDFADESDSVLLDSLIRLQLMDLNYDILRATEIGKTVSSLRKRESKEIRQLTKKLIEGWKIMVDEWVKASEATTESTPESLNPSVVDDGEGLPSPPLDEGAFFPQQTMELSQFFDGMDDDGNPRNYNRELNKKSDGGRKPAGIIPKPRGQSFNEGSGFTKEPRAPELKKQEAVQKPIKAENAQFGPGRPAKPTSLQKVENEVKVQPKPYKPTIQRRPAPQTEKPRGADEDAVELKIEATKRKLQERYQQAENAKRQRTIQVMEVHDLPKQKHGVGQKNAHGRSGNGLRQLVNRRR